MSLLWSGVSGCSPTPESSPGRAAQDAQESSADRASTLVFYDVGERPRTIAVADFNGDKHLDVAVANGDGNVTVLSGDSSGRLGGSALFTAGPEPSDVDAADLDRDGDVDLVVANHETPNITVLFNDGQGRFASAPGSPFDTGATPHVHGLATGDFDSDGWFDVAVESADSDEVRVLRGGPRGFSAAIPVAVGTMPYFRLGVCDVIGDGRLNVLVPGHGDNTVRALESARPRAIRSVSDGGGFRMMEWTIQLSGQPWMVVGSDVNGDVRDDIVVVETDAVSIWLATVRGFAQATGSPFSIHGATEVAVGDLDGDGVADVAVGPWEGDEVTVLVGTVLSVRKIRVCDRPIGLAIADLDGDGRGELLAACSTSNQLAVTTVALLK